MSHAKPHAHTAPVRTAEPTTHAAPSPVVSEFAALLGGALGGVQSAPPEASAFDGLLAKPVASGRRRRLVVCYECGNPHCFYSHYVDE